MAKEKATDSALYSYSFPKLGITVEAKDLEEATKKAREITDKLTIS